ncbi:MAG: ABC transporter ATP-binding protein [Acholeplasmataceae bacterium]
MQKKQNISWLYAHQKNLIKPLIILSFIGVILSLSAIFFAFYSKETVDAILADNQSLFISSAIVIASIMMINLIGSTLNHYLKVYYKAQSEKSLRKIIFKKLLIKDQREIDNVHSGELMTYLTSDIDIISDGIIEIIPRVVFYVTRFMGAFVLIFVIDQLFALIFLALGAILLIASRLVAKPMRKRHRIYQEKESQTRAFMQESLEHMPLIKSFEKEEAISNDQDLKQEKAFHARLKKHLLTVFTQSGMQLFFAFGYTFAIIFGAYRLQFGLTVGSLLALIQLVGHIQTPFTGLSSLIPKANHLLASTERLRELDTIKEEQHESEDIGLNTDFKGITISNLQFKYDQTNVIDHLNFEIKKGDFVHIVGQSGKGKTTLFNVMLALYLPQAGEIIYHLKDQSINASKMTRALFSYVPQGKFVLSGTIRNNLCFYALKKDEDLFNALKVVGLYEDIMALPLGLDTQLKEKGTGLSEGQLQRLAIARALLRDAPVLLLDEITSALDQKIEQLILKNLKTMTHKTVLISSHRVLNDEVITKKLVL